MRHAIWKKPLFVTTLDVQKAFDVVDHEMLLRKLYLDGIQGGDWVLLKDLYTEMTTSVKWESHLSSPFVIRQGVRQGGILSTSHYKRYNNPLLIQIEDKYIGAIIGSFRIPHITVADGLALLSNEENEMQYMLDDSGDFSNQDRYIIHPKKSGILTYLKKFGKTSENEFKQQGKPI